MRIRVLYFAALRERRGQAEEWVDVTDGTTLQELYSTIFPAGPGGAVPVAFTQNQAVVPGETLLESDATVSFLPPLGGG